MNKKRVNKHTIWGLVLLFSFPLLWWTSRYLNNLDSGKTAENLQAITIEDASKVDEKTKIKEKEPEIPASSSLLVPYAVQAPYANWAVHEESCEEAALFMYHQYLLGQKTDITAAVADKEFRAMKAWQVRNYGTEPDLSIERLGAFARTYYGDSYRVITGLDEAKIKEEVASGRPVLVPVMTQSLKNPHYSPGNVYHILLIRGYDSTGVITNDAGVKEGKNWHYTWATLWGAIDAQKPKMKQGRVGLVLTK